jgi:hypothetical protein
MVWAAAHAKHVGESEDTGGLVGRTTRLVGGVGAAMVLVLALWVGWELRQGPTVTREVGAGTAIPLTSHLGTATVPAGWTGKVTALRSGPIPWLEFKASRTLASQVVELRSSDGLAVVTVDVTRGPGAWRESLARDREQAKRYAASPYSMQSEQADPGSDGGYGGRKSVSLTHIEPVDDSWGMRMTVYIWDRSAPAILSVHDDHRPPSDPSALPGPLGAGLKAVEFAAVSR